MSHIFDLGEAAVAYALCAERIYGSSPAFLNANAVVIPIFVSQLFQSLEISIKHACIESKLFTLKEARNNKTGKGHGIKELAELAVERLGGFKGDFSSIVNAMTFLNTGDNAVDIIHEMICGEEFEDTRSSYSTRSLGYAEVSDGDFAIIHPIPNWIDTVKQVAANLNSSICVLSQWQESPSKSTKFMLRY
jgi:hypothetical protein